MYKPKLVKGTVKNTGTKFDDLTLTFGLWDYDNHSSYHVWGYETKDKEKFLQAMKDADDLYQEETLEEFIKLWDSGEYDALGAYCIDIDKVDVIEVICEEVKDKGLKGGTSNE